MIEPKQSNMKKQVKHGGDTWNIMYSYTHNGEQWLALSKGHEFCSLPARYCTEA